MEIDPIKKSFIVGRIFSGILMVFFVLLTPWWLYFSLLIFFLFYFDFYYESVFIGFLIDTLYGPLPLYGFPFLFTLLATIIVLVFSFYRLGSHR